VSGISEAASGPTPALRLPASFWVNKYALLNKDSATVPRKGNEVKGFSENIFLGVVKW
jgi:hypothetical protein